ncbi:MAG TPA: DUF4396 domain-containing protein [Xanthobacteraceae bacterium]|nr:DUF4396 domain-containing protein [Xanthobacteraceae bacterium]
MLPAWLQILSLASLTLAGCCALVIAVDEVRHPQQMWIMNVVWPVTALFGSLVALLGYFRYGRVAARAEVMPAMKRGEESPPFPVMVAKGTCHCGSGCCIGDILAEWLTFFFPAVAIWLGWQSVFAEKTFAVWILDFLFAFVLGVVFQYFTIKPMRNLSPGRGLVEALKADTLSLTAWQLGMYSFMAFAQFYVFWRLLGLRLEVNSVTFWFAMQLSMVTGFATSYPVNWWLVSKGIKEKM